MPNTVGIQRYLRENGDAGMYIFRDLRYKLFQDSLNSKMRCLTSSGRGKQRKQAKPLTEEEDEICGRRAS